MLRRHQFFFLFIFFYVFFSLLFSIVDGASRAAWSVLSFFVLSSCFVSVMPGGRSGVLPASTSRSLLPEFCILED
ncbi:hypothetical protein B0T13DRAFT_483741 [Neurospora crassa]|nr:hypothetical protein B0T13DRAFT_483741 [Neurospora crassa]